MRINIIKKRLNSWPKVGKRALIEGPVSPYIIHSPLSPHVSLMSFGDFFTLFIPFFMIFICSPTINPFPPILLQGCLRTFWARRTSATPHRQESLRNCYAAHVQVQQAEVGILVQFPKVFSSRKEVSVCLSDIETRVLSTTSGGSVPIRWHEYTNI